MTVNIRSQLRNLQGGTPQPPLVLKKDVEGLADTETDAANALIAANGAQNVATVANASAASAQSLANRADTKASAAAINVVNAQAAADAAKGVADANAASIITLNAQRDTGLYGRNIVTLGWPQFPDDNLFKRGFGVGAFSRVVTGVAGGPVPIVFPYARLNAVGGFNSSGQTFRWPMPSVFAGLSSGGTLTYRVTHEFVAGVSEIFFNQAFRDANWVIDFYDGDPGPGSGSLNGATLLDTDNWPLIDWYSPDEIDDTEIDLPENVRRTGDFYNMEVFGRFTAPYSGLIDQFPAGHIFPMPKALASVDGIRLHVSVRQGDNPNVGDELAPWSGDSVQQDIEMLVLL